MISIILPYKPDGDRRDIYFNYVFDRYRTMFPDAEIVLGNDTSGHVAFCRSHAINNGVARSHGDQLIISDVDLLISKQACLQAFGKAFVIPFGRIWHLTPEDSDRIIKGEKWQDLPTHFVDIRESKLAGGIHIMTRQFFDEIGGYSEEFLGWGWEDTEFCKRVAIYPILKDEIIYHLWHPRIGYNQYNEEVYRRLTHDTF